ncbi:MAG: hypothetical protein K8R68_06425 [Bacteroidales bacterium]|nr:hypothetical protein [Bacteroidales bacterium]
MFYESELRSIRTSFTKGNYELRNGYTIYESDLRMTKKIYELRNMIFDLRKGEVWKLVIGMFKRFVFLMVEIINMNFRALEILRKEPDTVVVVIKRIIYHITSIPYLLKYLSLDITYKV